MSSLNAGFVGGQGWETMGTPPGGGSFYDVPGKIDPGTIDPFRGPEQFESEYTGKSGWEDVWKSLALAGGQAIITKTFYKPTDRGSGNRTEILKGTEKVNMRGTSGFFSSLNPASSTFSSGSAGIIIAVIAAAIMLLVFLARR